MSIKFMPGHFDGLPFSCPSFWAPPPRTSCVDDSDC